MLDASGNSVKKQASISNGSCIYSQVASVLVHFKSFFYVAQASIIVCVAEDKVDTACCRVPMLLAL